jgi:hypothetical protein
MPGIEFELFIGSHGVKLSIQRDFLLRVGRRELYWSREQGWSFERVRPSMPRPW